MKFPRSHRLVREVDLELVRRTGKRLETEHLDARASATLSVHPRVGVVVPKYGNRIVNRNRVKRRLRELARLRMIPLLQRVDVLVRAKPGAYGADFEELEVQVDSITRWARPIGSR